MGKCQDCNHDCHCKNNSHKDDVDICKCKKCNCMRTYTKEKDHSTDISFENEVKYE